MISFFTIWGAESSSHSGEIIYNHHVRFSGTVGAWLNAERFADYRFSSARVAR